MTTVGTPQQPNGGEEDDEVLLVNLEGPAELPAEKFVDRFRETMRGAVALGLLGLLLLEVALGTAAVWHLAATDKVQNAKVLTDWLSSVITGTIALLGAATGFYYGTRSSS